MRQFLAFTKKEFVQQARSGKLLLVAILFGLFGIMNPAMAKLTPWLMEQMAEELAESGMVMTEVTVDALNSWTQFFKNMPLMLVVFILMFSGSLTDEIQSGTLINVLAKGLKRPNVILSKASVALLLWTIGYYLSFGITYGYNAYFWDNSIAKNIGVSVFCLYLMGVFFITVIYAASAVCRAASAVTLLAGAVFGLSYLLGMLAQVKKYVPTFLMGSGELMYGKADVEDYAAAIGIALALSVVNMVLAVVVFNRKEMI